MNFPAKDEKQSSPFFSVVIATYNSALTLATCINSITNQSFQDFEILVFDNDSKDGTVEIIQAFASKFPCIGWRSAKDNGVYDAMNNGVRNARGSWLYFIGSDDFLYDDSVFEKVAAMANNRKDKIIYGSVLVKGDAGWASDGQVYDGKFSINKIIARNICHQAIFYHREVFEKIGFFNEAYRICADHDFNIRAATSFKFQFYNIIVATFSAGGMSTQHDPVFLNDFEKVIVKYHPARLPFLKVRSYKLSEQADFFFRENKLIRGLGLYAMYIWKRFINRT